MLAHFSTPRLFAQILCAMCACVCVHCDLRNRIATEAQTTMAKNTDTERIVVVVIIVGRRLTPELNELYTHVPQRIATKIGYGADTTNVHTP